MWKDDAEKLKDCCYKCYYSRSRIINMYDTPKGALPSPRCKTIMVDGELSVVNIDKDTRPFVIETMCHKLPPRLNGKYGTFPIVGIDSWCGSFKTKE